MYNTLIVTPEFEHYKKARLKESCPITIQMKTQSKEWITERIDFTRTPSNATHTKFKKLYPDQELLDEIVTKINTELDRELAANTLVPLREFVCDCCKNKISVNEQPIFVYSTKHSYNEQEHVFVEHLANIQILHGNEQCIDHNETLNALNGYGFIPIDNEYLSRDQFALLAALQDDYPKSEELTECIKRITIPYYEEYRLHQMPLPPQDWSFQKFERAVLRNAVLAKF